MIRKFHYILSLIRKNGTKTMAAAANAEMTNNAGVTINKNEAIQERTRRTTQQDRVLLSAYNDAMEDHFVHRTRPQQPSYLPEPQGEQELRLLTEEDTRQLRAYSDAMEDHWLRRRSM